mmetsp:Transcript_23011/g.55445  ORF Transcript_23011/g.55445 Transcript_23011/m.55445 type:complete len:241 (-) Transcript_23011:136-858(-)
MPRGHAQPISGQGGRGGRGFDCGGGGISDSVVVVRVVDRGKRRAARAHPPVGISGILLFTFVVVVLFVGDPHGGRRRTFRAPLHPVLRGRAPVPLEGNPGADHRSVLPRARYGRASVLQREGAFAVGLDGRVDLPGVLPPQAAVVRPGEGDHAGPWPTTRGAIAVLGMGKIIVLGICMIFVVIPMAFSANGPVTPTTGLPSLVKGQGGVIDLSLPRLVHPYRGERGLGHVHNRDGIILAP